MKKNDHAALKYQILLMLQQNGPLTETEITHRLADIIGMDEEELDECYENRPKDKVFYKSVATNEQHLKAAGLVEFFGNYGHRITDSGTRALVDNETTGRIEYGYLRQFPEYCKWIKNYREGTKETTTDMKMPVSSGLISHQERETLKHYNSIAENGCTMLIIPRKEYHRNIDKDILSEYPCLYILSNGRKYYIGYSGNAFERIYTHSLPDNEPFKWTTAYVFLYTDKDDNSHINIADAAYLEYLAFQRADSSKTVNHKGADSPYMKRTDKTKMDEIFTDIAKLLEKSNVDVFKR